MTDGKIYLKFDGTASNCTISDFLQCVKPPKGKSFYATGWAKENSLSFSFMVLNYMSAKVPRLTTNSLTGKSEFAYQTETVDLQIYPYYDTYESRVMCKDGKPPLTYMGASNSGLLSIEIQNNGKNNYSFNKGETRIKAQYKSPDTTVEIVVVR